MGEAGMAGGASVASLGLSAASSVVAGEGRADQYRTQAENYRLRGAADSENYLLEGSAKATNYLYEGAAKKAEYGVTAAQDTFQAERADRAAAFGKAQATATDATMRDQLNQTLGNIDVIRAAGHADPTSPTTAAVKGYETGKSDRQRMAALVSIRSQVSEDEASSAFFKQAAGFALTQGTAAEEMAKYNAGVATTYATRNAATARRYAAANAGAAESAADTAETTGFLNAAAGIFGGLARVGGGPSTPSTRPRVGPFE